MTRRILFVLTLGAVAGLLASGCIISSGEDDPCKGITCDGHGTCMEDADGEPYCECEDNYHAEGLSCIFDGYTVSLEWTFGEDQKTCMNAQVGQVHVEVLEADAVLVEDTLDCSAGGVDIEEMDDGDYTVNLTGINNAGDDAYRASVDFSVAGSDEDLGVVILDPFGFIEFSWEFGIDGLDCTAAGVERVKVAIYDEAGETELFRADPIPYCDDQGAIITNWDLGSYNLVLEGVCASDLETGYLFDGIVDVTLPGRNDFGVISLEDVGGCP